MADDPLDQTARDGGRPKHEPPTIDLEAADVSDGTTTAPAAASRAPMLGLLTPLLSGAVAALAVCGALWAGGVIGLEPQTAPPLAVSPADHAALVAKANDLTTRLAKLEARPQPANSAPSPAVDPARLAATRLPRKPLADIAGMPMIVHVWRRAMESGVGRVAVATDSDEIAARVRGRDAFALFGWKPYMHNPRLKHWLHRVDIPTLVLWGERDRIVKPELGTKWRDAITGANLDSIADAGHFPHWEQPQAFADRVAAFAG